jgi:hypothetical protein
MESAALLQSPSNLHPMPIAHCVSDTLDTKNFWSLVREWAGPSMRRTASRSLGSDNSTGSSASRSMKPTISPAMSRQSRAARTSSRMHNHYHYYTICRIGKKSSPYYQSYYFLGAAGPAAFRVSDFRSKGKERAGRHAPHINDITRFSVCVCVCVWWKIRSNFCGTYISCQEGGTVFSLVPAAACVCVFKFSILLLYILHHPNRAAGGLAVALVV